MTYFCKFNLDGKRTKILPLSAEAIVTQVLSTNGYKNMQID